jgi:hypothetical protein
MPHLKTMAKNYSNVKSKINRNQLNPLFHLQDKKEDCKVLSKAMIKQAKKSGILNMASKGLGTGKSGLCFSERRAQYWRFPCSTR